MTEQEFSWEPWAGVIKAMVVAVGLAISTALYVFGADANATRDIAVLNTKYDSLKSDVADIKASINELRADVKRLLEQKR